MKRREKTEQLAPLLPKKIVKITVVKKMVTYLNQFKTLSVKTCLRKTKAYKIIYRDLAHFSIMTMIRSKTLKIGEVSIEEILK